MMSTFHLLKDGYTMVTKGAVDVLIKRIKYIRKMVKYYQLMKMILKISMK